MLNLSDVKTVYFNHRSNFLLGGFEADTGLSGRKIVMDTYCGLAPHGGGSFSGKDPSKVDRTAAYMARYVAKSIVANGLASTCVVSLAYAFGCESPVMLDLQVDGTTAPQAMLDLIKQRFDFRPDAMIERLSLLSKVLYSRTTNYGHFSDNAHPWEQVVKL